MAQNFQYFDFGDDCDTEKKKKRYQTLGLRLRLWTFQNNMFIDVISNAMPRYVMFRIEYALSMRE